MTRALLIVALGVPLVGSVDHSVGGNAELLGVATGGLGHSTAAGGHGFGELIFGGGKDDPATDGVALGTRGPTGSFGGGEAVSRRWRSDPSHEARQARRSGLDVTQRSERQALAIGRPHCAGRLRPVSASQFGTLSGPAGTPQVMFACTEQSRPSRTTTPAATSAATPPGQPFEGVSTTTTQSGIDQPEVTEMSTFGTTVDVTNPVSTVQPTEEVTQGLDDAICQVNFHEVNSLVNGTCPDRKLSFVRLNSSVGFAAAICTESQTEDSGALTTLYMTIQPQCRRSGEQQRWSICSWQPNPTSEICSALDQQCCDRVTDTNIRNFFPANTDVALLACQEYVSTEDWDAVDGDVGNDATSCNLFYGWNGTHPQTYALELLQCTGGVPADPQCSNTGGLYADPASGFAATKGAATQSASTVGTWISFGMGAGIGFMLLGAALRVRRMRLEGRLSRPAASSSMLGSSRRQKKHQFVDWMQKTTADIPLTPVNEDGFLNRPRSKKHRDFVRLYEKLDDEERSIAPEKTALL